MIRTQKFAKYYDGKAALEPLTHRFLSGKTTVVIGPSGCGKSTLLRLILGLVTPSAGNVSIGNETMNPKTAQGLRRKMGFVNQEGGLFPHLIARDNILLAARHFGREKEALERIPLLFEMTHIEQ